MSQVKTEGGEIVIMIEKADSLNVDLFRTPGEISRAMKEARTLEESAKILEEMLNGPYDVDANGNLVITSNGPEKVA
jgi:preprotein translocase subunit SecA